MIRFLFFLIFCISNYSVFCQISHGGSPILIGEQVDSVFNIKDLDYNTLFIEDSVNNLIGKPPRVAKQIKLDVDFFDIAEKRLTDKGFIYRLSFSSVNAKSLALNFNKFYLPEGAKLFAYSVDGNQVLGSFNSNNNHQTGQFVIGFIYSNEIVLELFLPLQNKSSSFLNISHISYGYKNFLKSGPVDNSDPCQVDVNCSPEGDNFQDEKRGVVKILFLEGGSYYICSGSLINNASLDCKPYILTADHCGGGASASDMNQWVFYFNYEKNGCGSGWASSSQSVSGASFVSSSGDPNLNSTASDFLLLEMNYNVPLSYNAYYNGWLRNGSSSGVSIHHPSGDPKKISTYTQSLQSSGWNSNGGNTHWRVYWSPTANGHGVTEGGSSGSPIFTSSGLIVGQLTGGSSTCSSPYNSDLYGKMSFNWQSNGSTPAKQLKPWLDPNGTNIFYLEGTYYPCSIQGCTDILAFNYNPQANVDDGSCIYYIYGCTDTLAINYDLSANQDDGSCIYAIYGCIDVLALNYDSNANTDDGSCVYAGCTDLDAVNYNPNAIVDDSSCVYPVYGCIDVLAMNYDSNANVDDGSCVYYIYGCTDVLALNYDPNANTDDNSCFYTYFYGCTNPLASNYDSLANIDDGSCLLYCSSYSFNYTGEVITKVSFGSGNSSLLTDIVMPNTGYDFSCSSYSDYTQSNNAGNIAYLELDSTYYFDISGGFCSGLVSNQNRGLRIWIDWNNDGQFNSSEVVYTSPTTIPGMSSNYYGFVTVPNNASLGLVRMRIVYQRLINPTTSPYQIQPCGVYQYGETEDYNINIIQPVFLGCTDSTATNYDSNATQDDGTCVYPAVCNDPTNLFVTDVVHTRATFNWDNMGAEYYRIRVNTGSGWSILTQIGSADGFAHPNTSKTRYFLQANTTYDWQVRGWCLDGSVSGWSQTHTFTTLEDCPNAANLGATNIEAEWATMTWDAASAIYGVDHYLARVRQVGQSSWNIKGSIGNTLSKTIGSLTPGATYEFETRTWCNTGDNNNPTDPYYKSDWGGNGVFTTIPCLVQTDNLAVTPINTTTATFSWDLNGLSPPADHFTIRFREIGVTNWQYRAVAGGGTATGRNIGGFTPGVAYEWQVRTFCGVTSTWKSPWESGPDFTLGSGAMVNVPFSNLEVYPNPSRDKFNISFSSDEIQSVRVKITNMVGEEVYSESLPQFIGEYTKQVDLSEYAKGVYFLRILSDKGGINKKLILQ